MKQMFPSGKIENSAFEDIELFGFPFNCINDDDADDETIERDVGNGLQPRIDSPLLYTRLIKNGISCPTTGLMSFPTRVLNFRNLVLSEYYYYE